MNLNYRFFPSADRRQDEVWDYTANRRGKEQAMKYIHGLHEAIAKAVEDKGLWRFWGSLNSSSCIIFKARSIFIFFRLLTTGVLGVISILHEEMDIPNGLKEDRSHT